MPSRLSLIIVIILSLPILIVLYNPSIEMGSIGMILGFVGYYISPVIIFGTFFFMLFNPQDPK